MPTPISVDEPREYLRRSCGYTTLMPDEVIQEYLNDPYSFGSKTFCAKCKMQVPDSECTWVETGESLRSYMLRLQQNHSPVAGAAPRLNLQPTGFRRFLAIALFALCVIIPVQSLWKDGELDVPQAGRTIKLAWYLWPLAIAGSIFSLTLYFPSWGFKRYALLCGPVAGIGALMFLSYWLSGRTTIYRFEPLLVASAGALPGLAVWVLLILRKIERRRVG